MTACGNGSVLIILPSARVILTIGGKNIKILPKPIVPEEFLMNDVRITTCRCGMVHCCVHPFGMLDRGIGYVTIVAGVKLDGEKFPDAKSRQIIEMLAQRIDAGSQIGICDEGFCVRPMNQSPGVVRDIVKEVIRGTWPSNEPITSQLHALGRVCSGICGLCRCSYGAKGESQT